MSTLEKKESIGMSSESVFDEIDQQISDQNDPYRTHLGFSVIGDDDERKGWLSYHWSLPSSFEGRMLRLFDLGNRIEDQVVDNIANTTVMQVSALDNQGNQYRGSILGGHVGGACDGFLRNVPGFDENKVFLLEVKSANDKRFKELKKIQDYQGWSKTYQWQIHCYMGLFNVDKTMVIVVNKNDSNVYTEIIDFNPSIWEQAQERAERLVFSNKIPDGMSENDWRLKNAPAVYRDVYLGKRLPPSVNCRNCKDCKPLSDGSEGDWWCNRSGKALTPQEQRNGCRDHLWRPEMVNADYLPDKSEKDMTCYQVGIFEFYNVTADKLGEMKFSSPEMRELSKTNYDFERMKEMFEYRTQFDGEISRVHVMDEDKTPF